jgi:hypothetical protein
MHAMTYRTEILREAQLRLPEHTFYVDNIFAYVPLPYTENLFYLPVGLYHYFIGRSDQSIQMHNFTKRYEQQIKVMKIMVDAHPYVLIARQKKGLKRYMKHCLSAIMMITQMFTMTEVTDERKAALRDLWTFTRKTDRHLYRFLRYRSMNVLVNFLPARIKRYVMVKGYLYLAKKIKLG